MVRFKTIKSNRLVIRDVKCDLWGHIILTDNPKFKRLYSKLYNNRQTFIPKTAKFNYFKNLLILKNGRIMNKRLFGAYLFKKSRLKQLHSFRLLHKKYLKFKKLKNKQLSIIYKKLILAKFQTIKRFFLTKYKKLKIRDFLKRKEERKVLKTKLFYQSPEMYLLARRLNINTERNYFNEVARKKIAALKVYDWHIKRNPRYRMKSESKKILHLSDLITAAQNRILFKKLRLKIKKLTQIVNKSAKILTKLSILKKRLYHYLAVQKHIDYITLLSVKFFSKRRRVAMGAKFKIRSKTFRGQYRRQFKSVLDIKWLQVYRRRKYLKFWGRILKQKQLLKRYFGSLSDSQLKHFYYKIKHLPKKLPGPFSFFLELELTLHSVLLRSKLFINPIYLKDIIERGYILVNNKIITDIYFKPEPGSFISFNKIFQSRVKLKFLQIYLSALSRPLSNYFFSYSTFSFLYTDYPNFKELNYNFTVTPEIFQLFYKKLTK